jgi:hypothetical protein
MWQKYGKILWKYSGNAIEIDPPSEDEIQWKQI